MQIVMNPCVITHSLVYVIMVLPGHVVVQSVDDRGQSSFCKVVHCYAVDESEREADSLTMAYSNKMFNAVLTVAYRYLLK